MRTILDLGIAIGLCLVLLKGADFFVRPHQRQQIQSFFEDLALWLDDVDIKSLPARLTEPPIQALLFMLTALVLAAFALGLVITMQLLFRSDVDTLPPGIAAGTVALVQAGIFALSLCFAAIGWRSLVSPIVRWVIGSGDPHLTRRRTGKAFLVALIFSAAYQFVVLPLLVPSQFRSPFPFWESAYRLGEPNFYLQTLGLAPGAILFLIALTVFYVGGLASSIGLGQRNFLLRATLALGRGVVWRIVEYEKGVIASLVLLLTIVLSIVRLWL